MKSHCTALAWCLIATASATGILMQSGINTATITNSGSLTVDAIVNGPLGTATANGIVALGGGGGALPGLTDVLTINNSGDIIVRESISGGLDWRRGMAIDVALAPNNTVINLLGGGNVYGNIDLQDGDVINVDNGETSFDGIINPECMPPVFDDALVSACGQGDLNIFIPVSAFAGTEQSDYVYMYQRWGNADASQGGFEETALIAGITPVPELSTFFPIIGLMVAVGSTHMLRRRKLAMATA